MIIELTDKEINDMVRDSLTMETIRDIVARQVADKINRELQDGINIVKRETNNCIEKIEKAKDSFASLSNDIIKQYHTKVSKEHAKLFEQHVFKNFDRIEKNVILKIVEDKLDDLLLKLTFKDMKKIKEWLHEINEDDLK
jgi:hypothetical protein